MLQDITTGNTAADGKEFNFWFIGNVQQWCGERGIQFNPKQYGLRNTGRIEIKWGMYSKGEERTVWAATSDKTALSILIRGDFTFRFREPGKDDLIKEVRLCKEGDYALWNESLEHTWQMQEDSVTLTLRWPP
ncbi:MAG: hypothetical protein ISR96_06275 [Nitrospira sp.]|nr:hypothetical protein [bacterium]MBL7049100.1 hypothetical protein [Nitrospira sp.]